MQRVPVRRQAAMSQQRNYARQNGVQNSYMNIQRQNMQTQSQTFNNEPGINSELSSPMLHMARRVRSEQGIEQLKSFLVAMEPFSAPNELRSISMSFGMDFDSLPRQQRRPQSSQQNQTPQQTDNQFKMLQMLMGMRNMKGMDMQGLLKMMKMR